MEELGMGYEPWDEPMMVKGRLKMGRTGMGSRR